MAVDPPSEPRDDERRDTARGHWSIVHVVVPVVRHTASSDTHSAAWQHRHARTEGRGNDDKAAGVWPIERPANRVVADTLDNQVRVPTRQDPNHVTATRGLHGDTALSLREV